MGQMTIRYATAATILLAVLIMAASAFAESSHDQRPSSAPADPNGRQHAFLPLEPILNRNAAGPNAMKAPPRAPAQAVMDAPVPAAPPVPPALEPVLSAAPPPASARVAPSVLSNQPVERSLRREPPPGWASPTMIRIAAPAFAQSSSGVDGAAPAPDAAMLYAPPVRSPWWERLLSSRGFLYASAFCLFVVPVAAFAASVVIGRRREERGLAFHD